MIDPDNFTVSSDIGRICVQGEGAWRRQLQKMNVLPFFSRAEQRPFKIPVQVPADKTRIECFAEQGELLQFLRKTPEIELSKKPELSISTQNKTRVYCLFFPRSDKHYN